MSTGTVTSFLACRRAQASFWHVDGHILACRRPQLCRFWHVDGHRRHFGMSTGKFWHVHGRSYVVFWPVDGHTSFWHVDGRILACRRAHLLFYTLPFFLSSLLFGIAGRHFDMSGRILACRRAHLLFYTLLFFLPAGRHFWHVDGRILHVDRHIYYFTLCYFSFPAYFLASRAVILTCRRAHIACHRAHLLFYTRIRPSPDLCSCLAALLSEMSLRRTACLSSAKLNTNTQQQTIGSSGNSSVNLLLRNSKKQSSAFGSLTTRGNLCTI